MKGKTVFGALLVSVALCSQGFGFELLDRMLGLNCGGCGGCNACSEVAACEPAACEPEGCEPDCCKPCCRPACDLFSGLRGLLDCKRGCDPCGEPECREDVKACAPEPESCEPACKPRRCRKPLLCRKPKCRDPNCCEVEAACEPAACEPDPCEPACKPRCKKRCVCVPNLGLLDLLDDLFRCRRRCGGCEDACGETGCGGGAAAPAQAPEEEAAPLPRAPVADPSASIRHYRNIVRN